MSGLAHYLEDEGIPTTLLALVRKHVEEIKPPRALVVPFELGRPIGAPNEPDFQRRVLRDCLELLEKGSGPVLKDFPDSPPGADAQPDGWACPVNFSTPIEDVSDQDILEQALLQEIALLKPWYEESKQVRDGRTNFGISGKEPGEIQSFLADLVINREGAASPIEGKPLALAFKQMADDIRYYYMESAIARPDQRVTDVEIGNWLWGETTLGKVLIEIRNWAMESKDPGFKAFAPTAMVPSHQRHRTIHG
ncbi:MAG: hypothetical protein CL573_00010 [Alphaproteobacteria bacterium]|nr:hypothetical protein [Alphaproteobacteria bacterium]HCP00523.1 hypothetical protein [Rhodospirillaceae bacterium]